jgi:DNA (cytosine-5)-methyltransferase 1
MDQVEHELVSLLPTPLAGDAKGARNSTATRHRIPPTGIHAGDTLTDAVDLLPTPSASRFNDGEDPETWQARHDFHASKAEGASRAGKPLAIAAVELLPTPTVGNVQGGNKTRSGDRSAELLLPGAALSMLPTPSTANAHGNATNNRGDLLLPGAVVDVDFRKYTTAVRRAEQIIGRPAPAPAIPDGKGGAYRLHSRFVEWMMMLPEGWVTGHGIGRNPELARLGNGVVPLQAAYAVRELVMRAAATR